MIENKKRLSKHIETEHELSCERCGYKASDRKWMRKHIRVEQDEKLVEKVHIEGKSAQERKIAEKKRVTLEEKAEVERTAAKVKKVTDEAVVEKITWSSMDENKDIEKESVREAKEFPERECRSKGPPDKMNMDESDLENVGNTNEVYTCDNCKFYAKDERDLKDHKNTEHLRTKYLCDDECGYEVSDENSLRKHRRIEHKEQIEGVVAEQVTEPT